MPLPLSLLSLPAELLPQVQAKLLEDEHIQRSQVHALRLQATCKTLYDSLRLSDAYVRIEKKAHVESYLRWAEGRAGGLQKINIQSPVQCYLSTDQRVDKDRIFMDIGRLCPATLDDLSICVMKQEELSLQHFQHCAITRVHLDVFGSLSLKFMQTLQETFPRLQTVELDTLDRYRDDPQHFSSSSFSALSTLGLTSFLWQADFLESPCLRSITIWDSYLSQHPQHRAFRTALAQATRLDQVTWSEFNPSYPEADRECLQGADLPLVKRLCVPWTALDDIISRLHGPPPHPCKILEVDIGEFDDDADAAWMLPFRQDIEDVDEESDGYEEGTDIHRCHRQVWDNLRSLRSKGIVVRVRNGARESRGARLFDLKLCLAAVTSSWPMRMPDAAIIREQGHTLPGLLGFPDGPLTSILTDDPTNNPT